MADEAQSTSASDKDKKEHQPPKGATRKVTWTSAAGHDADIDVISEWSVLRKKERPAAEMFHTYYRLAAPKGRRPVSFVFNGGPGASSAYLHVGGLSPRRVLLKPSQTHLKFQLARARCSSFCVGYPRMARVRRACRSTKMKAAPSMR